MGEEAALVSLELKYCAVEQFSEVSFSEAEGQRPLHQMFVDPQLPQHPAWKAPSAFVKTTVFQDTFPALEPRLSEELLQ